MATAAVTAGLAAPTAAAAATVTPAATWTQQHPAKSPPARYGASMAYDPATSQTVLFGGFNNSALLGGTWTWNGSTWAKQSPATSPSARDFASMAYDPATSQMVLFGGVNNSTYFGGTWTYDASTDTWTQQHPAKSPSARAGASMAYDPATRNMVLFGGIGNSSLLGGTWTWNGSTWAKQSPARSPSARKAASMAYDPATSSVVLFGGIGNSGLLSDTWTYDASTDTWTEHTPSNSPSARAGASMAYDPATSNMVLFGGFGSSGYFDGTWTWNGTTWTEQTPTTSPSARFGASMAYDPATGNMVLFGGYNGELLADTWTYQAAADDNLALSKVPSDMTVDATSPSGAVVTYSTPTVIDEGGTASVSCTPPSGSTFPVGITTVTCSATSSDDTNSPVSASFTVTVRGALAQLNALQAYVDGLAPGTALADQVQAAIGYYQSGDIADACTQLGAVVHLTQAQSGKHLSTQQANYIISAAERIEDVLGC